MIDNLQTPKYKTNRKHRSYSSLYVLNILYYGLCLTITGPFWHESYNQYIAL